jgi:hypothetical protein
LSKWESWACVKRFNFEKATSGKGGSPSIGANISLEFSIPLTQFWIKLSLIADEHNQFVEELQRWKRQAGGRDFGPISIP